jgi:hypothetical protein
MGTKSRESIYGSSIRASAEWAREARNEADRARRRASTNSGIAKSAPARLCAGVNAVRLIGGSRATFGDPVAEFAARRPPSSSTFGVRATVILKRYRASSSFAFSKAPRLKIIRSMRHTRYGRAVLCLKRGPNQMRFVQPTRALAVTSRSILGTHSLRVSRLFRQ